MLNSFESVAATLVEQYSGVHLREGRSLGQPNLRKSGHLQTRSVNLQVTAQRVRVRPIRLTQPTPGTMRMMVTMRRIRTRRRTTMKPPTQPLVRKPRQGTMRTQKTTSYPSPKQLPQTALRNLRSPQNLDMLYSYNWQHMQPLAKQKAKVKASLSKVRAKVRVRLCVAT